MSQEPQLAMEPEFASAIGAPEGRDKLSTKDPAQHLHRKEERVARFDPGSVIRRQPTGWNNAMNVRMVLEFLTPGVQHAEETDISAEVLGIAGNFKQCFGAGAEKQTVDDLLVLQGQWSEQVRQRENKMGIARGKEFLLAVRQPTFARAALAFWAVPVSARVVRDGAVSAAGAFIDVATERRRAATFDGSQDFSMARCQPPVATLDEVRSRGANEIGHLQRRPIHLLFRAGPALGWRGR